VNLYVTKTTYEYWKWSICNLFSRIGNFKIELNEDNVFIHNGKKYKFFIEEFTVISSDVYYNFTNFSDYDKNDNNVNVYVKYKEKIIFYNFKNK
jgi:hypothetical protein